MTLQHQVFDTAPPDAAVATEYRGIRQRVHPLSVIVVSGALTIAGTSSAEATRVWETPYVHGFESTASGLGWETRAEVNHSLEVTRRAISELRRISGLTWEQLGEIFDVSRRSVHFWASGKPLNASNEKRLLQVLGVVRAANRGNARATRAALFGVKDGTTPFALLVAGRFQEALAALGDGIARRRPPLMELTAAAKAEREPLPLEHLVEAQHGRVHRDRGTARAARTVRNKRRGTP